MPIPIDRHFVPGEITLTKTDTVNRTPSETLGHLLTDIQQLTQVSLTTRDAVAQAIDHAANQPAAFSPASQFDVQLGALQPAAFRRRPRRPRLTQTALPDNRFRTTLRLPTALDTAGILTLTTHAFNSRIDALTAGDTDFALTPNWHTASANGSGGTTGGPACLPVPPAQPPTRDGFDLPNAPVNPAAAAEWAAFASPNAVFPESVTVAVLDTLPDWTRIGDAADAPWCTADHRLRHLLNLDDRWHATYLDPEDCARLDDVCLAAHRKATTAAPPDFSDHGLFVAGIINSLAPAARIHQFQVLGPYGTGDLTTLLWGLDAALGLPRPLIINLSLTLNVFTVQQVLAQAGHTLDATLHPLFEQFLIWPLHQVLASIAMPPTDQLVVAAAGNAGDKTSAHYPARLGRVIGVGALDTAGHPTAYSNRPDIPTLQGFEIFGGDPGPLVDGLTYTDPTGGILGVYTAPAYPYPLNGGANTTGWARWAGTSFAAPILTGLVSRYTGQHGGPLAAALTFLRTAFDENLDHTAHAIKLTPLT